MPMFPRPKRRLGFGLVALMAAATTAIAAAPPAGASLGVLGSAYGYYSSVSLFGGPAMPMGPFVTVKLPVGGSATPITASAPSGSVVYGPATLFSSGPVAVSTQGINNSAASSASLQTVGNSPFSADSIQSFCNAKTTATGGATITNGVVVTSTDVNGNPVTTMNVPTNPPAGYSISGTLKLSASDTEKFKWVFNQQTRNASGTLTVDAAREILKGPTAVGNLILGQSICRG